MCYSILFSGVYVCPNVVLLQSKIYTAQSAVGRIIKAQGQNYPVVISAKQRHLFAVNLNVNADNIYVFVA